MKSIRILKFGGSCLSSAESIVAAAEKVISEASKGRRVIVVLSALNGVTDKLLDLAEKTTSGAVSKADLDDILSMGERTSVLIMSSTLRSLGVDAIDVNPDSEHWPIFTDSNFGNADVDLHRTKEAVVNKILPLLKEGRTPVVAGFIGLSYEGEITTLGRGGSDLTAVVLGNILDADEVIFFKDVKGVYSADPKVVSEPRKMDSLSIEEAYGLTSAGAKIIQPKALLYKKESIDLRVTSLDASSLCEGTIIKGELVIDLKDAHAKTISERS